MTLDDPLHILKGVGEALAQKFAVLGIKTVRDLIDHYPRRYENYAVVTPVHGLKPGPVTIQATITQASGRYVRRGMHITEAIASDETGSVRLIWFNQPYRAGALKKGVAYFFSGQFELSRQRFVLMNPSAELVSDFPLNTARVLPVYRETKGLTSRQIRTVMVQLRPLLKKLPETLPENVIAEQNLISHAEALTYLHLPESMEQIEKARARLGFEEVFQLSLASLLNKRDNQSESALQVPFNEKLAREFVSKLPFTLTNAQRKSIWQMYLDMQKPTPMNRLIEGDVGAGKTVVAAMAALMVMDGGWQVALMAPTELLARQHAETITKLLTSMAREKGVVLLVGSMNKSQKEAAREAISTGKATFIIGTHALIQEQVDMHKLALVIIDEQHRFGVEQRKTLMAKAGHMPHVLSLTATPIPRTLALTLYGELDISVLDEKPAGRLPILTEITSPNSRAQMNERIVAELDKGHQMFVVCPLISESSVLEADSAEKVYERMRKKDFKDRRIGLLHGRMKADEKQSVMEQFVKGELEILVSTTVIEVGVDVPKANVMLIESAERFGLAQLHQLRGRVGRGSAQAYCFLALSDSHPPSRRLRALESSNDGFRLAELDLQLRGPGAIYGLAQHGQLDLRIAKLTDTHLIAAGRQAAQEILDAATPLLHYKELMSHVNRLRAVTNLN